MLVVNRITAGLTILSIPKERFRIRRSTVTDSVSGFTLYTGLYPLSIHRSSNASFSRVKTGTRLFFLRIETDLPFPPSLFPRRYICQSDSERSRDENGEGGEIGERSIFERAIPRCDCQISFLRGGNVGYVWREGEESATIKLSRSRGEGCYDILTRNVVSLYFKMRIRYF